MLEESFPLTFFSPLLAIANIAWRFYIIFAVLNFAWFPIIWYFYVETKGLSLEEVDLMFKIKYHAGKGMTYKQAGIQAQEETEAFRQQELRGGKDQAVVETDEYVVEKQL